MDAYFFLMMLFVNSQAQVTGSGESGVLACVKGFDGVCRSIRFNQEDGAMFNPFYEGLKFYDLGMNGLSPGKKYSIVSFSTEDDLIGSSGVSKHSQYPCAFVHMKDGCIGHVAQDAVCDGAWRRIHQWTVNIEPVFDHQPVAAQGTDQGALAIDSRFLASLNRLTRISNVLFPSGDAHVRYALQAVPTPAVTDMKFVLSGRELHYFNQKQEWTPFEWPGPALENLSHIEWQTKQGGLRTAFDSQGRFGLIRLLERAKVSPQDSARYRLTWTPDTSQGIPLRVQLRSEAGAGPLDALQLRHFKLPTRIFVKSAARAARKLRAVNPPPLPAPMTESAKHAAMPLPRDALLAAE